MLTPSSELDPSGPRSSDRSWRQVVAEGQLPLRFRSPVSDVADPGGKRRGGPQEEEVEVEDPQWSSLRMEALCALAQRVRPVRSLEAPPYGVPLVWVVQEPRGGRRRLSRLIVM